MIPSTTSGDAADDTPDNISSSPDPMVEAVVLLLDWMHGYLRGAPLPAGSVAGTLQKIESLQRLLGS